jgi:uncharacterized SAM-binding protein YcdF (DUF218 family)
MMLDQIKNNKLFYSIILLILLFFLYFLKYFIEVHSSAKNNYQNKSYDAAVVLTGDKYRINKGLELIKEDIVNKLLISGVNKDINKNQIEKQYINFKELFNCCIEIENKSRNTFENARESYLWMKNNNFKSLIIISSSYHLPRTKLEFSRFIKEENIFFLSSDNFLKNISFKKLFIEYIKYIRTNLSLIISL